LAELSQAIPLSRQISFRQDEPQRNNEVFIYPKSVKDDLTPDQKKEIKELVNMLKKEAISRVQKIKR
jgi:hypothetical protein